MMVSGVFILISNEGAKRHCVPGANFFINGTNLNKQIGYMRSLLQ